MGKKPHNEELNDLYSSPNIIRMIKSSMRWAGRVARMGERGTQFWVGKPEGKSHLEDLGVDRTIILR